TVSEANCEYFLGEAQFALGQVAEGSKHIKRALALFGRPVPASPLGLAAGILVEMAKQARHLLFLYNLLKRQAGTQPASLTLAVITLAWLSGQTHETLALIYLTCLGLNIAEAQEPSTALAGSYAVACGVTATMGLGWLARRYDRLAWQVL